eukprot:COSAG01_NODE_2244_length_8081_cov_4.590829_1_plen_133_part_00
MAAFGASWGYGAWLYIPEIMPLRVRGKAVGLCTFVNWGPANNLSAMLTPWMLKPDVFGAGGTLLCLLFLFFSMLFVSPELGFFFLLLLLFLLLAIGGNSAGFQGSRFVTFAENILQFVMSAARCFQFVTSAD